MKKIVFFTYGFLLHVQVANAVEPNGAFINKEWTKKNVFQFKTLHNYRDYLKIDASKGFDSTGSFRKDIRRWNYFTDYLPLTAGSSYALSGVLYGVSAEFSSNLTGNALYSSGGYIEGQNMNLLKPAGGAKVTFSGSNYGFAFEQPGDLPSMRLRRADGATNELQTWDGEGNTSVSGTVSANALYSAGGYIEGKNMNLLKAAGGAKVTLSSSNYGFAFEQPGDLPSMRLRRADGATNELQTWDGEGNSSLAGNFGIGTPASSSERLIVNGNIRTKKLIVTQTGWSDYVFAKDYKLRSLSSLETFIKQNKHLPEVPSGKEVEEKGISVGDNQALLLKKIEELTLYVIEMNKKNSELAKRMEALERRLAVELK